ncbi:hypothetical protein [Massilia sp. Root351]|uniref:hypothetical protein n=1 Tax=Massilia sp. Root351 TaxID=1736522 RepID=UPI000AC1B997|nr:hypothetical protein [Massilia sp. Root351]
MSIIDTHTAPQKLPPRNVEPSKPEGHQDAALDEGLDETFPASDPVAISIPKPSTSPL